MKEDNSKQSVHIKVSRKNKKMPSIPSYLVYQYLVKRKSNDDVLAVLTLFNTTPVLFDLKPDNLEPLSLMEYFEDEILETESYSEVLQAIGNGAIDITDIEFQCHNSIQIPYASEDDGVESTGTIHDISGTLFKENWKTLFTMTPTWNLEMIETSE